MLQDLLPDLTSDITSAKIVSGATIYRDRWSIPHIYAENAHDAFFAQGYATAQDRLWQMDFDRLRCLGRAAEYLGSIRYHRRYPYAPSRLQNDLAR